MAPKAMRVASSGDPAVLSEARQLVSFEAPRWKAARISYGIQKAPFGSVAVSTDSSTCALALEAYVAAAVLGAGGVPGLPDSLPYRLVVVRGPGFFLVE